MSSTVESTDNICGATRANPYSHNGTVKGEGLVCGKDADHSGKHKDRLTGQTW